MERRTPSLLKYWLTLIIGTIVLSAGITWLAMNVGAQGLPDIIEATGEIAAPPSTVFDKEFQVLGNTITINAGKSIVGKESTVSVGFTNEGQGPLLIQLVQTSCKCVHDIKINGQAAEPEKGWISTPPGGKGVIIFNWKPDEKQLSSPELRLSAVFQVNDPQPMFSNGLRLEILTKPALE